MNLHPGQRVTAPDPRGVMGGRVECEFVRRISDHIIGSRLTARGTRVPQAIVRYEDGTKDIVPLNSIEVSYKS